MKAQQLQCNEPFSLHYSSLSQTNGRRLSDTSSIPHMILTSLTAMSVTARETEFISL